MEPTVYIIDDDAAVRDGFARLVRRTGHAVQVYDSAEAFLAELPHVFTHPACAVVDLVMPGLDGIELQARVNETPSPCSIVFVSGNGSIPATVQAMRRGAITFLTKPVTAQSLLAAVEEGLHAHKLLLTKSTDTESLRIRIASLSERERETMSWVITGALNKQIAAALGISERTVKAHRANILEKTGVTSVADLVRLCDAAGFPKAKQAKQ